MLSLRLLLSVGALAIAGTGTATAVTMLPAASVTSATIRDGAVRGADLRKGAIASAHVRDRSLRRADLARGGLVAASSSGATGPQGPVGAAGPSGPTGPAGATVDGAQGPSGAPGAEGEAGEVGAVGPEGDAGDPGGLGAPGPDGPQQGPIGDFGPIGPDGPMGAPGLRGGPVYLVRSSRILGPVVLYELFEEEFTMWASDPHPGRDVLVSATVMLSPKADSSLAATCTLAWGKQVVDVRTIKAGVTATGGSMLLQGGVAAPGPADKARLWCHSPSFTRVDSVTLTALSVDSLPIQSL